MAGFTPVTAIVQSMQQGARIAVMVEGEEENSDAWMLSQLLRDVAGVVKFLGRGSWQSVEQDAEALRQLFPGEEQRVFTIRDRDFLPDEEALPCYAAGYTGARFVWKRYTLENYLLEPHAVFGALDALLHDRVPPALAPQAAGNWLIRELNDSQVLSAGLEYAKAPEGLSAAVRRVGYIIPTGQPSSPGPPRPPIWSHPFSYWSTFLSPFQAILSPF